MKHTIRGSELVGKLNAYGGTLLGRRVISNRTSQLRGLPAFKHWGGIVRVGKRGRVDIRWADGSLSRNQYIGDYLMHPSDIFVMEERLEAVREKVRKVGTATDARELRLEDLK
jgi:hypothetical protein